MKTVVSKSKPTSTKEGVWALNRSKSDSLTPFLRASGVPFLVAPLLGSLFDKDDLHIGTSNGGGVTIELKREKKMFIKLQTDVTYERDTVVQVETPLGPQYCQMIKSSAESLQIVRKGPSSEEQVDEEFELKNENELIQTIRHKKGDHLNVELKRIYSRK